MTRETRNLLAIAAAAFAAHTLLSSRSGRNVALATARALQGPGKEENPLSGSRCVVERTNYWMCNDSDYIILAYTPSPHSIPEFRLLDDNYVLNPDINCIELSNQEIVDRMEASIELFFENEISKTNFT